MNLSVIAAWATVHEFRGQYALLGIEEVISYLSLILIKLLLDCFVRSDIPDGSS